MPIYSISPVFRLSVVCHNCFGPLFLFVEGLLSTVPTLSSFYLLSEMVLPRNQAGVFATGEIRQNIKFAAFWSVFLTKIKVDPESW